MAVRFEVPRSLTLAAALTLCGGLLLWILIHEGDRVSSGVGDIPSPHVVAGAGAVSNDESGLRGRAAETRLGAEEEEGVTTADRAGSQLARTRALALDTETQPSAAANAVPSSIVETRRQMAERARLDFEHDQATATRRAEQAAKALKLDETQALLLADHYLASGTIRRNTLAVLRAREVATETTRQAVEDLSTREREALTLQFGRELALKIEALDSRGLPGRERARAHGLDPGAAPGGAVSDNHSPAGS